MLIADNNEKKSASETKSTGKINEQNKQNGQQRRNDSQKNLLIDLSNDPKPAGNSWVSDETLSFSLKRRRRRRRRSAKTDQSYTIIRRRLIPSRFTTSRR